MPDPRFYEATDPASVSELAELTGATITADGACLVQSVAPLSSATAASVAFIADRRYLGELRSTVAAACFAHPSYAHAAPQTCTVLLTEQPQAAYAAAAARLHRPRSLSPDAPAIDPSVELEPGVRLGRGVVIGQDARVGAGTEIGVNSVIGPGVCIGRDCRVGNNVSISFALIGDRVRILSGAVVGEAGFGVAGSSAGAVDIPQLGRVIIQDEVTIGACSCIDRGAWDDTVVGERTKIDNLVQIAHNVRLGRNCLLAAHTGLSGSVTVGDGAMFGGRAGIADHLEIGAGAKIAAAAGVMKNVPEKETWCGTPARPLRRFMRETAWVARNAQMRDEGKGE